MGKMEKTESGRWVEMRYDQPVDSKEVRKKYYGPTLEMQTPATAFPVHSKDFFRDLLIAWKRCKEKNKNGDRKEEIGSAFYDVMSAFFERYENIETVDDKPQP
jgi:hypothetical protein